MFLSPIVIMSNKITKALAAIVLLVILGYFGTTWYSSTKVEEQVTQRTQTINAQLRDYGLPAQVSTEKKDSGLFSSRYVLTLSIDGGGQSHALDFDVQIEHGPLPLSRLQQGKLTPVQALSHVALIKNAQTASLFELSQDQPPLEMELLTQLDGNTNYHGNVASLSFNNSKDGQLHFDGMSFEGKVDASASLSDFAGKIPLLQLTPPPGEDGPTTLIFRDLSLSSHFDGREPGSPVLKQQSTLAELSLANKEANVQVRDYQSSTTADTQNKLLQFRQDTVLNAVRINSVDLGKLQYGSAAEGLDPAGATQFVAQSWKLALASGHSDENALSLGSVALLTSMSQMLSGKPAITVGPIIWTLPEGAAQASINASLNNPLPLLPQYGGDPLNLMLHSLKSVRIELDADEAMPKGAADRIVQISSGNPGPLPPSSGQSPAEKLNTILDILVDNKLLTRKDGHIGLYAHVEGEPSLVDAKRIEMNGESFDPAGFVRALQERAATAERQVKALTPPENDAEPEAQDPPKMQ